MAITTHQSAAPPRTTQQRMEALHRANDVRSRRAQLKRELKAGRGSVAAVLRDPPEYIGSMKVMDLLLAIPHWGRVKAGKALAYARVSPTRTVGGITERQRAELVAWMRGR